MIRWVQASRSALGLSAGWSPPRTVRAGAAGAATGQDVQAEVPRPSIHSSCCSARTAPTRRISEARSGKIPTTSVRRRISWLSRSCGLLDQICRQISRGKAVKASTSARAVSRCSATAGNLAAARPAPGRTGRGGGTWCSTLLAAGGRRVAAGPVCVCPWQLKERVARDHPDGGLIERFGFWADGGHRDAAHAEVIGGSLCCWYG